MAQPLRDHCREGHARSSHDGDEGGRARLRARTLQPLVGRGEQKEVGRALARVVAAATVVLDERLDAVSAATAPPSFHERLGKRSPYGGCRGGLGTARGPPEVAAAAAALGARGVPGSTWAAAAAGGGRSPALAASFVVAAVPANTPFFPTDLASPVLQTTAAPPSWHLTNPAPPACRAAMNIPRLLFVALAFVVATTSVSGKTCYFRDPCSRWRLLAGRPGDFLVDACGKAIVFSNTCLARRISSCRIEDPCTRLAAAAASKEAAKSNDKSVKGNKERGAGKGAEKGPTVNLIPRTFRGAVVKDRCNRPFRVSRTCKLIKISAACYKACHVKRIMVGRRYLLRPGTPFTCASRCR